MAISGSSSAIVGSKAWRRGFSCVLLQLLAGVDLALSFEPSFAVRRNTNNDRGLVRGSGGRSRSASSRHLPHCGVLRSVRIESDDSADRAEPLPLTAQDLRRLRQLQARRSTMPLMILDSMLPRQKLTFKSDDPKFRRLVRYCLEESRALCMIGLNPHTGRPISRGVTLAVTPDCLQQDDDAILTWQATAQHRAEVQGEPWMDDTGSFYLADIELMVDAADPVAQQVLSDEQQLEVQRLSKALPQKLREWMVWVVRAGATDQAGMDMRLADLGPMPKEPTDRAFWAGALVNPLPALGVCLEIRPALLSCSNDLDRLILTTQAIQSSIDHLSGKHRLF